MLEILKGLFTCFVLLQGNKNGLVTLETIVTNFGTTKRYMVTFKSPCIWWNTHIINLINFRC